MPAAAAPPVKLRDYQFRIARECEKANTIVVLPTGSGKTLIAAEVIKRLGSPALFLVPTCLLVAQQAEALQSWTGLDVAKYRGGMMMPPSFDVLVTTPEAFRMAQRDAARDNYSPDSPLLQWEMFRVVVFDEVHHVLKEHPYRKLALSLQRWSLSRLPSSQPSPPSTQGDSHPLQHRNGLRLVGLTASYTYTVGDKKVEASLRSMCSELLVTNTETASSQELKESGYHAVGASAEVVLDPVGTFSVPLPEGVVPVAARMPHEMGSTFFRRIRDGRSTAFTSRLMACVRAMEKAVSCSELPSFSSPLPPSGEFAPREWGAYAHKLARDSGSTSARGQPTRPDGFLCPMLTELEHWYEALKTLVVTWEEAEDEAAMILDMGGCKVGCGSSAGQPRETWPGSVRQVISAFWAEVPETFPRYEHLKDVLMEKYVHHGGGGGGGSDDGGGGGGGGDGGGSGGGGSGGGGSGGSGGAGGSGGGGGGGGDGGSGGGGGDGGDGGGGGGGGGSGGGGGDGGDGGGGGGSGGGSGNGGDGGGGGGSGGGGDGGRNGFRGVVFVQKRVTTHVLAHVISIDPKLARLFSTACLYAPSSRATASLSVTKSAAQTHLHSFRDGSVNLLLSTVVAEEGMDIPAANCTIRFDVMQHAVSLVQGRGRARQAGSSFVVLRERTDRTTADLEAVEQQQLRLVRNFKPPTRGTDAAPHETLLAAQRSREIGARGILVDFGAKMALTADACSAAGVSNLVPGALSSVHLFSKTTKAVLEDSFKKEGGLWVCTMKYESPLRDVYTAGSSPGKKIAKHLAAGNLVSQLLVAIPP